MRRGAASAPESLAQALHRGAASANGARPHANDCWVDEKNR